MAEQRAHFALFSYPSKPLDFGLATKLAGVEPTTIHHVGEPRKGAKWEYDLWRYYPGGNDLTAQINHALAFIKPESPFAEYARSVEAFVRGGRPIELRAATAEASTASGGLQVKRTRSAATGRMPALIGGNADED